jgi:hypothetical protein
LSVFMNSLEKIGLQNISIAFRFFPKEIYYVMVV